MRLIKPIEVVNGKVIFHLDADLGNADWIRGLRLLEEGRYRELEKKFNTPMYDADD